MIELIKASVPITEVLEQYTNADLSRVNANKERFNIRCPFHDDRQPSFTVYTDTNRWKCWAGCGQGDVIDLVAKSQGIPLRQAVKLLAEQTGLHKGPQKKKVARQIQARLGDRKVISEYKHLLQDTFQILLQVEKQMNERIRKVKSMNEAESLAELYHKKDYVSYLLDCITSGDDQEQVYAVYMAQQWLDNEIKEAGKDERVSTDHIAG